MASLLCTGRTDPGAGASGAARLARYAHIRRVRIRDATRSIDPVLLAHGFNTSLTAEVGTLRAVHKIDERTADRRLTCRMCAAHANRAGCADSRPGFLLQMHRNDHCAGGAEPSPRPPNARVGASTTGDVPRYRGLFGLGLDPSPSSRWSSPRRGSAALEVHVSLPGRDLAAVGLPFERLGRAEELDQFTA